MSVCIRIVSSMEKATTNGLMVEHTLVTTLTTRKKGSEYTRGRTARNTKASGATVCRMALAALPTPKVNRGSEGGRKENDWIGSKTKKNSQH